MNPFYSVMNRPAILADHPAVNYLASDEFRSRSAFAGATATADRVRAVLYILECCALDPRRVAATQAALDNGAVHLDLFGVCDPIGIFELPEGPDLKAIRQAVERNQASAMFDAARRALYWRDRSALRQRHEDAVRALASARLAWPTPEDFRANRDKARAKQSELIVELDQHMQAVRTLRNVRLAKLSSAASPGVPNWMEFLANVAQHTFMLH